MTALIARISNRGLGLNKVKNGMLFRRESACQGLVGKGILILSYGRRRRDRDITGVVVRDRCRVVAPQCHTVTVTHRVRMGVAGSFVKEGILGADFTFTTNSDLTHTVDYLPKNQARKLYTYAKEQLDVLKNPKVATPIVEEVKAEAPIESPIQEAEVEEVQTEEVTLYAEIMPTSNDIIRDTEVEAPISEEKGLAHLSQDELFAKLQNYKKLLDNGLILQGEYDRLKGEILKFL